MIVAVASRKASPGVTSLTAALALFWPGLGVTRLIVEADASGGTLAARWSAAHGLSWDPGLLTLSTTRAELSPAGLAGLTQPVADGVLVAAAPPAPDQVSGALARWGQRGPAELAGLPGVVTFADCGRLAAGGPGIGLATRAVLTLLVCRPRLDEIQAVLAGVPELAAQGLVPGLVCVGDGPYPPAEIATAAGIPLVGVVPDEPGPAAVFDRDGANAGRAFRRSRLAAALAELARAVHTRVGPMPAPAVAAPGPDPFAPVVFPPAGPEPARPHGGPGLSPAVAAALARRRSGPEAGSEDRTVRPEGAGVDRHELEERSE